jgi:hypothetical protein
MGYTHMEMGDMAEAIPLLERVVEHFELVAYRPLRAWFTIFLAEACVRAGQVD